MAVRQDANWEAVSEFVSELRNASRLAALVDAVVDMYESDRWRRYTDATGAVDEWRDSEYDYFLIACGAQYADVQKLLSWDRARAAELAAAMESEDPMRRRPIEDAAAGWRSPTGTPLTELAARQGWTIGSGALRVSPAPERARTVARHGMTADELARKRREELLPEQRRRELARLVDEATDGLSALELRYVRDRITARIAKSKPAR
jgi:hypothetical protein